MSDQLTIRVNVDNNQTVSKFAVSDQGSVSVYNDAGAALTVSFEGSSPLCESGAPQMSIDIAAGLNRSFKICDGSAGNSYKYTATVAGAGSEDPIILVEQGLVVDQDPGLVGPSPGDKSLDPCTNPIIIFENCLPYTIAAGVVGLVAGYLVAKFLVSRGNRSPR